jgi:hypothetical protein
MCRGVGGLEYERDRPAEFATVGLIPKQQLLAMFDEMVEKAVQTFAALDRSRLSEPSTEPAYYSIVFEDLFGVAIHLATHGSNRLRDEDAERRFGQRSLDTDS